MTGGSRSQGPGEGVTIQFGPRYAESEQFKAVFREGMALVEQAAAYLDGDGRRDARGLSSATSLAYATESMLLTTRLMQLASWLLIRRAVNEGELSLEDAVQEHNKVRLRPIAPSTGSAAFDQLPGRLKSLIEASLHLHRRVLRLDAMMNDERPHKGHARSPLSVQLEWLQTVFESKPDDAGQ